MEPSAPPVATTPPPTQSGDRFERLARELSGSGRGQPCPMSRKFYRGLRRIERELAAAREALATLAGAPDQLTPDVEWLLDNFYVIQQSEKEVRTDLPPGYFCHLPAQSEGTFAGWPRVYELAAALVSHTDGALDEPLVRRFVAAYQEVAPLTIGELWAVPTMLRVALLETLRRLAGRVVEARNDRAAAEAWVQGRGAGPLPEKPTNAYVGALSQAARDVADPVLTERVAEWLSRTGANVEDALWRERQRQATDQVSIGNCVTSLRLLNAIDWAGFFEETSRVEAELRTDPGGVYARQDFATRDACRRAVERLARGSRLKRTEAEVVRLALDEARAAQGDQRRGQVSYWLIGDGYDRIAAAVGYRPPVSQRWRAWMLRHPDAAYFGALAVVWLAVLAAAVLAVEPASVGSAVAVAAAAALPLTELTVALVNFWVCRVLPPRILPKLDFRGGVPEEAATFVVIPCLLTRPDGVRGLLERLELHYLANPDPNLRFALLTDFADAPAETMPTDDELVRLALDGIRNLNTRHAKNAPPRFFLFHRRRQFNPSEGAWMGWERKRGKLSEFNHLLRGATDTSYTTCSADPATLPRVRYILTLDADTVLPQDAAPRLIGTLAHPLNVAELSADGRRVVRGYGVLQPRVSFLYLTGFKSLFARLFAGSAGVDPYSSASSDTYMDLFARGTFTGKGLYDLDAFEAVTGPAFPPNHILSHDLIECNFARCGLVTDVDVYDEFPPRYHAYARREHRWVRGDWQLLPWLAPKVPTAEGVKKPNVFPLLERWKVFDNLRRSLVPLAVVAMAILGWTVLPGPGWFWSALAAVVVGFPLVIQVYLQLHQLILGPARGAVVRQFRFSVGTTAGQVALAGVFLANQAVYCTDAVLRTLWRLFVSRRHLLEWETAAATEARLGGGWKHFVRNMWQGVALAVAAAFLVAYAEPARFRPALPWLVAWVAAPVVAWWVSRPRTVKAVPLAAEERPVLRRLARKTWLFFETFVGPDDHCLPPDNFQEEPGDKVAHRTSPTNIGLYLLSSLTAHDLGYLTAAGLAERVGHTFDTLDKLETFHGHFLNWYETTTLRVLPPAYVSTVDSGNLLGCLITLKHGLKDVLGRPVPNPALADGLADTLGLIAELARAGKAGWLAPEVAAVRDVLAREPADLVEWDARLADFADRADRWEAKLQEVETDAALLDWVGRFDDEVRAARAELRCCCPWVDHLPKLADPSVADLPADRRDRWWAIYTELARPASLNALTDRLPELAAELDSWSAAAGRRLAEVLRGSRAKDEAARLRGLISRAERLADRMDFRFLYHPDRDLFAIGYHVPAARPDSAFYDLLASEACLTSFLLVARGQAPKKHWFQLARPSVRVGSLTGLLSWGGTMFEYLMPRLLLPAPPGTLLDTAQKAAVRRQIEYGREVGLPWGVSESGYYRFDADLNYQYQAFGVPGLGIKRGLSRDLVVAPYATAMAVPVDPRAAEANLARLAAEGGEGRYGLYEAIDYTPDRLAPGQTRQVVRSYMAHHQGMALTAIANRLFDDLLPRRLGREPAVKAVELLLQERVPTDAPAFEPPSLSDEGPAVSSELAVIRRLTAPDTPAPRTHVLSNGRYTVLVTNAGGGLATCKGLDVYRWRADRTCDPPGQSIVVRDPYTGEWWSTAYLPVGRKPDGYEVLYSIDKAEFRRHDGSLATVTEVIAAAEHDAEVRRVTLTNHGPRPREVELTSCLEPVLMPHAADLAHPAFGKLFLETEWDAGVNALLCRRRPRSSEQNPVWCAHAVSSETVTGEVSYETDRATFVGRRQSPADPAALRAKGPLGGTTGPVLDPVLAIRYRVTVPPEGSVSVSFVTGVADTREAAVGLAAHFAGPGAVARAFDLAWAHARVELLHLGITARQAHLYQRLAGHCLFPTPTVRNNAAAQSANRLGQSRLWPFGISGDLPIVLVRVEKGDQAGLVKELVVAQRYLRDRGVTVDVVLLDERPTGYRDELKQAVADLLRVGPGSSSDHVFTLKADQIADDDRLLLLATARVVLTDAKGTLAEQLDIMEPTREPPARFRPTAPPARAVASAPPVVGLLFDNGTGGFTPDGREYVIRGGAVPPAPWANVIANPAFGFVVTDSGGGYSWAANSQLNRLTPWSNDPVSDPPGEVVYLRDEQTGEFWTPTPLPAGGPTTVRHGQGYTKFQSSRGDLEQELTVFVAPDDPVKLLRLRVSNRGDATRSLSATFYAEWVLGTTRDQVAEFVVTEEDPTTGAVFARNYWNPDFCDRTAFVDVSRRPRTLTTSRVEFLGRLGSTAKPAALGRVDLSGRVGAGLDPCAAVQVKFAVGPGQSEEVVFLLGEADDRTAARHLATRYRSRPAVEAALAEVVRRWDDVLGTIQVQTPDPALDVMVNRWLLYQVLSCRLWGRSGFYQSGGAYGFRDQLQDVMALVYAKPDEARQQILRAASRQFPEGDVQHWWHPPAGRGTRTRFSDDFLFLPFVTVFYVRVTGDASVLDESVRFIRGPRLAEDQYEHYLLPEVSEEAASVYDHCVRALNHGWKLGGHGLPLMGIGDWNDGMNRVGVGGKGESVWVAWFQIACLLSFADLAERREDRAFAAECRRRAEQLGAAVEAEAWDGGWYRRAYFDDGTPLGSAANDECRIDSLVQSWAAITGAGDPDRADTAVTAALDHLVDWDDRLARLFAPPFDKTARDPGYIKGYLPGIRENGGQYTHAACWLVQGLARLGRCDEAVRLYDLLNPVRQADTPEKARRYRVEPYVVAADVYGCPPHVGRGGWTWYTGSASWLYRVALEELLGFRKEGDRLRIEPCVPASWGTFSIQYRHGRTTYRIRVETGAKLPALTLDGSPVEDGVELADDGRVHEVVVQVGPRHTARREVGHTPVRTGAREESAQVRPAGRDAAV